MTEFPELITSESEFRSLKAECSRVFNLDNRLPDPVFAESGLRHYAFEHGYIFLPEFANLLTRIADVAGDPVVNYMTVDPSADEYYHQHCGFYGAASFTPGALKQRYLSVMSRNRNVDSFQFRGGDVGVFWGSSLTWGIMNDRKSWELAVLGTAFDPGSLGNEVQVMDWSSFGRYVKSQYSHNAPLGSRFLETFGVNYRLVAR